MEEVKEAYEVVKRIDVLDVSVGRFFVLLVDCSALLTRFRWHGDLDNGQKCI